MILSTKNIDSFLLWAFRYRTRGFLRMENATGTMPAVPGRGAGYLYLHIPFCETLCPFCSFHRVQHKRAPAQRYFHSLRSEARRYYEAGFRFSGAYFGGGTPTTEPEELVKTIELTRELFNLREISVETNPRDLQPELLKQLRQSGVTRLSVGVQSFDDLLLRRMERYEAYGSGAEAQEHIRRAAGLFPTLNVDLIFNFPGQDQSALERDLRIFKELGANQVSLYPLMTSPAISQKMAETMGLPDQERLRQFYQLILDELKADYPPSSAWCFTKRGHAGDEYIVDADYYIGVGSGAFSYVEGTLFATTFSLKTYQALISEGLTGITVQNRLSRRNQLRYSLLVKIFGLRLNREWALERHGPDFFRTLWPELKALEWTGAARQNGKGWELTERGMYLLMLMMCAFFESVSEYRDAMRAHIHEELNGNDHFLPGSPPAAISR